MFSYIARVHLSVQYTRTVCPVRPVRIVGALLPLWRSTFKLLNSVLFVLYREAIVWSSGKKLAAFAGDRGFEIEIEVLINFVYREFRVSNNFISCIYLRVLIFSCMYRVFIKKFVFSCFWLIFS